METSSNPFSINPDLPFSSLAIPTLAGVIPSVSPERIVEPVERVTVHGQAVVTGPVCV